MTTSATLSSLVDALRLPPEARLDTRVPKKLLMEQGAPTAADKRAIQEGIDELQWFAACKPANIGVPIFKDSVREYLEIAVIGCEFRATKDGKGPKESRLVELIHRAIPYPVLLIAVGNQGVTLSVAHKRAAQNEAGRTVIDRVVQTDAISKPDALNMALLASLPLSGLPRRDLSALYQGWLARIEAFNASLITGRLQVSDDLNTIDKRRAALENHSRLSREIVALRARANREKQLSRRVDLNLEIRRLEAEVADLSQHL